MQLTTALATSQARIGLDYFIEYCILAMAFFLPLSLNVSSIFLSAGATLWLAKMLWQRQIHFQRTPFDRVIAALVILAAISITASPDRDFSFYNYYHLMGRYVLIYYLVVNNFRSAEQLKSLVRTVFISSFLVVVYGFYQYHCGIDASAADWVDGDQFPDLKVRIFSTLENPNLLAGFLVMAISLAAGVGLYAPTQTQRLIQIVLVGLLGTGLVLTYCRGAWVGMLAVVAVCGLIYDRRVFWVLLGIPLILLFNQDALLERFLSIANPTDTSAVLRLSLWQSTLAMIMDKPFTGIGWGAYWMVYPQYDLVIHDASTRMYHAHNTYLHMAAEIGLPGFVAFFAFIGQHVRAAFGIQRKNRQGWTAGLMLGILAAFAGLAVCGLTDHLLFNVQLSMMLWLLCALVAVVHQTADAAGAKA